MREGLGWARAQGLSVENDLSYVREFEHITFALGAPRQPCHA